MKALAAGRAVDEFVRDGMRLGLGSGSTSMEVVRIVGEKIAAGALKGIRAVATSFQTEIACQEWKIPLYTLNSPEIGGSLDLAIDGADEVDEGLRLTKGGGAALLPEKIVAYAAERFVVVVDEGKLVKHLGLAFPVPVELVPMARLSVAKALRALGAEPTLRVGSGKAGPIVTDHGNIILDIRFSSPQDPERLEAEIGAIPGVVETGFFTRVKPEVVVAYADGTARLLRF